MGNFMICGKMCDNVDIKNINKDIHDIKTNHLHTIETDVAVIKNDILHLKEGIQHIRDHIIRGQGS